MKLKEQTEGMIRRYWCQSKKNKMTGGRGDKKRMSELLDVVVCERPILVPSFCLFCHSTYILYTYILTAGLLASVRVFSPTPCMRVSRNEEVSISGRFMFSSLHVVLTHAKPASVHVEGINIKRALHRYKTISIGSMSAADQFYSIRPRTIC